MPEATAHRWPSTAGEYHAAPSERSPLDPLPNISEQQARGYNELLVDDGDIQTRAAVNDDGRVDVRINHCSTYITNHVLPTIQCPKTQKKPCQPPRSALSPTIVGEEGGLRTPRMNIAIHVVGSRGDVQPFVSLGQVLRDKYGHRVRVATHPTFQRFIEENGLEFFSIGGDPAELMAFMVKNPGLMPTFGTLKSGDIGRRRRTMYEIVKGCWRSCIETGNGMEEVDYTTVYTNPCQNLDKPFIADAIIANPPSFAHVHCAEKLGVPLHLMFTMPWSPTQSFPHPLTTIRHSNAEPNMTNLVSYALVDMMTWQGLGDVMNRFRTKTLDLEPVSLVWAPGMISRLRIPFTYCWSPALIPKPEDWGGHISLAGFYFLKLESTYTPDPKLRTFLDNGPPPIYIGFGSIVVDEPDVMTKIIFDAVQKSGVRALVSKGWGGLGTNDLDIPDNIFIVGDVPHDWLFKHVSAVVHHGGAGTTAAGILAGKPTVVVPFFGDQPFWGAMIARAGAGPIPVPYRSLTTDSLAASILKALQEETLQNAKRLSVGLSKDRGAIAGAESFHEMLHLDRQRCLVSPNRVAVARVKKTYIRLSSLAVTVISDEGLLKYSDLKLYRSREYDTGEEPWDPVSGGATALLGTISSLLLGMADVPTAIINKMKSRIHAGSMDKPSSSVLPTPLELDDDLSPIRQGVEETVPEHANLSNAMATDNTNPCGLEDPSYNGEAQGEARPAYPSHSITVCSVAQARHKKHLLNPKDRAARSKLEKAEQGASNVAITALRPPMDFSLALARGFHNAPKLYGDETVRPPDKINDFKGGVATAGRQFGLGWYDGITGLVMQPYRGATEQGATGFLTGVGKGISGFVLKPSAGLFGLGAYTLKGVYREVQRHMGATIHSYIIAARISQGHAEWETSTQEERRQIMDNYNLIKDDPRLKKKAPYGLGHHDMQGPAVSAGG